MCAYSVCYSLFKLDDMYTLIWQVSNQPHDQEDLLKFKLSIKMSEE